MAVDACITELVFERFRADLAECAGITPGAIERGSKLTELVPLSRRREVWRRLAERGYKHPALQLALPAQLTSVLSILVRSAALAWLFQRRPLVAGGFVGQDSRDHRVVIRPAS